MFERFTDRARRVIILAQEESHNLGCNYIGSEHIFLGLLAEEDGIASKVLRKQGFTLDVARKHYEDLLQHPGRSPSGHIPFTFGAKKILELSLREALALGHNYIGTEHILLGLVRNSDVGDNLALDYLHGSIADLKMIRDGVIEELRGNLTHPKRTLGTTPEQQKHYAPIAHEIMGRPDFHGMSYEHLLVEYDHLVAATDLNKFTKRSDPLERIADSLTIIAEHMENKPS